MMNGKKSYIGYYDLYTNQYELLNPNVINQGKLGNC